MRWLQSEIDYSKRPFFRKLDARMNKAFLWLGSSLNFLEQTAIRLSTFNVYL